MASSVNTRRGRSPHRHVAFVGLESPPIQHGNALGLCGRPYDGPTNWFDSSSPEETEREYHISRSDVVQYARILSPAYTTPRSQRPNPSRLSKCLRRRRYSDEFASYPDTSRARQPHGSFWFTLSSAMRSFFHLPGRGSARNRSKTLQREVWW